MNRMKLWIKTHRIVKWLFPRYIWDYQTKEKTVWLTFDDGPIPAVTPWVLEQLSVHNARATFFCIGDNVRKHPDIFGKLLDAGHTIGNHTFNHWNGWKTPAPDYLANVMACREAICERTDDRHRLFRPPYGRITRKQARVLRRQGYKIIMWDVVSADFDAGISPEQCVQNVVRNVRPGSIIVFHDSVKAWKNLEYALPKVLGFLTANGYRCEVPRQICS